MPVRPGLQRTALAPGRDETRVFNPKRIQTDKLLKNWKNLTQALAKCQYDTNSNKITNNNTEIMP